MVWKRSKWEGEEGEMSLQNIGEEQETYALEPLLLKTRIFINSFEGGGGGEGEGPFPSIKNDIKITFSIISEHFLALQ